MPTLKYLGWIETNFDPRLAETLRTLSQSLDNLKASLGSPQSIQKWTADGATKIFNLPRKPVGTIQLFLNGALQETPADYTLAENHVITVATPALGDEVVAYY